MKSKVQDFSKLPKWAQREINRLEINVEHYKKIAQELSGEKETNTFICQGTAKIPLPNNSEIEFSFGEGWTKKIQCNIHDGVLQVFADTLQVIPCANNHIHIKLGREIKCKT